MAEPTATRLPTGGLAKWTPRQKILRLGLVALTRTLYRMKVVGRANVPETGAPEAVAPA